MNGFFVKLLNNITIVILNKFLTKKIRSKILTRVANIKIQ